MGRTPSPLVIWTDSDWVTHPKILALVDKGHKVWSTAEHLTESPVPDLILSRAAWRWNDHMWTYLDVALRAARAQKKAQKEA